MLPPPAPVGRLRGPSIAAAQDGYQPFTRVQIAVTVSLPSTT